jgi:hypothetical protein
LPNIVKKGGERMAYQITHIRLSNFGNSTEHITHIKLSNGMFETKAQAVRNIDSGREYFYTVSYISKAFVETVHPYGREPYIRTKANSTTTDNLLSLPRF